MATDRKRVCMVTSSVLVVRWFLLDQLRALAQDHDVTLLVNGEEGALQAEIGAGVRVIRAGLERKISPWRDLKALVELMRIFRREQFDLVHSVTPKAGLLSIVAAWMCRVPVRIHTFQGEVWATRRGFMRTLLRFFDWLIAQLATVVLVVSASERQFLISQGIIPAGKSAVLANGSICGVDTERFAPPDPVQRQIARQQAGIADTDVLFLYVGRLAIDKGILDLVQAFDHVWRQFPQARLMIVGPDEEGVMLRVEAMALKARSAIQVHCYTARPEQYMQLADVVCLPSYREGFGMVLLEAAAMRVAVMASRIYGITDAVEDGVTGLLHPPAEIAAIEATMLQLLSDPALREQLAEAGMQRARRDFSRQTVIQAVREFYRQVLLHLDQSSGA